MPTNNSKQSQSSRSRARDSDGTYKGGVDTGEAWVPTEVEASLEKDVDYTIKPTVKPSGDAGTYSQKPKIRPSFGNVTTETY
jgi:large exoprotein involved in heme utilization and adhesion